MNVVDYRERDPRLRERARQTLRYELEGAAKDGCAVPDYGAPGHEGWEEVCHARDVLALLREVEALRVSVRCAREGATPVLARVEPTGDAMN